MFWAQDAQVESNLPEKIAIWDGGGRATYAELSRGADLLAVGLLGRLREGQVAFWVPPSIDYVNVQWGIWRAGLVAVPLCVEHPVPELVHSIREAQVKLVIHAEGLSPNIGALQTELAQAGVTPEFVSLAELRKTGAGGNVKPPVVDDSWLDRPAQILFTSGTTGKPKAAVATHRNLQSQVAMLKSAWGWGARDHTLCVLPLHHTHGIINVLCCALASGASVEVFCKFDPLTVWDRLVRPRDGIRPTLFMAVPTVYSKLLDAYDQQGQVTQLLWKDAASRLRLWVSGSAALPVQVLNRWKEVTTHTLLERYGMTEIGMAISNPLVGERKSGSVGLPLPGVEVRLVEGEIEVRGAAVFAGYLGREKETREAFTPDGWFKTGDQAMRDKDGYFRILGRSSVDIIKTGGYKVSALEIEESLREHPLITEVAVVGIPDPEWGERVGAVYVLRTRQRVSERELAAWARQRLAKYKVPSLWRELPALPRNTMGKVLKAQLGPLFIAKTPTQGSS